MRIHTRFFVRFLITFSLGSGAILASTASGICAQKALKIVAAVNNEVITSKDIDDYCAALALRLSDVTQPPSCDDVQFRNEALERMIEDKIILAEAKKEPIDVPQSMIEDRLSKLIQSYPSREAFEASLRERGLTITSLKSTLKDKIYMQTAVENKVKAFIAVSPQEVNNFYMKNKQLFAAPNAYMFYVAESEDRSKLEIISNAVDESGIDIVQKQYKDTLFPVESGTQELLPEFAKALEHLKEGEQTIEKIDDRYYFIHLVRINPARTLSLDDARDKVAEHLRDIKFKKRFGEWVEQLKTTAVIKRYATP